MMPMAIVHVSQHVRISLSLLSPSMLELKPSTDHGYSVPITNQGGSRSVVIGASWTRGLAVHPVGKSMRTIFLQFFFVCS
jgi:hypothetical protein